MTPLKKYRNARYALVKPMLDTSLEMGFIPFNNLSCYLIKETSCSLDEMLMSFLLPAVRKSHPELHVPLGELRKHLVESSDDMAPLKVWELQGDKLHQTAHYYEKTRYDK